MLSSHDQNQNAIKIQKLARGFLTRKKYAISSMPTAALIKNAVSVLGNDPEITGLSHYQIPEAGGRIVLIGTSGLRSVELACELGVKNKNHSIPKIIIVDHGLEVYKFWQATKKFFTEQETQHSFLQHIDSFLNLHNDLYHCHCCILNNTTAAIRSYLEKLINLYSYQYIKDVIIHAVFVRQKWENSQTFDTLKYIIEKNTYRNVFVYASNIVDLTDNETAKNSILNNIQKLMPTVTIHTDYSSESRKPTRFILCSDQSPAFILKKLLPQEYNSEVDNEEFQVQLNKVELLLIKHKVLEKTTKACLEDLREIQDIMTTDTSVNDLQCKHDLFSSITILLQRSKQDYYLIDYIRNIISAQSALCKNSALYHAISERLVNAAMTLLRNQKAFFELTGSNIKALTITATPPSSLINYSWMQESKKTAPEQQVAATQFHPSHLGTKTEEKVDFPSNEVVGSMAFHP